MSHLHAVRSKARWKPGRHAFRFIGLLFLLILLFTIDWNRAFAVVRAARPGWLALSAAANVVFILIKSFRWYCLLRAQGIHYGLGRTLRVYQAGTFLSVVTPGKIGDFAKAGYLREDLGVPLTEGVASVLIDRLLDLLTLCGSALVMVLLSTGVERFIPSILIFCALVAAATVLLFSRRAGRAVATLAERLPFLGKSAARLRPRLREVGAALVRMRGAALLGPVLLSVLAYACLFGGCHALALALRLPLTFFNTVYAISVANVIALLPFSVSGVGTRDVAIVIFFRDLGIDSARAVMFSLGYLVLTFVFATGLGAYYWLRSPLDLDKWMPGPAAEGAGKKA